MIEYTTIPDMGRTRPNARLNASNWVNITRHEIIPNRAVIETHPIETGALKGLEV